MSSVLFSPLQLRSLKFKNRIFMPPMCQYSAKAGLPNDWHFVHYATRALGGISLAIVEATAVVPEGRITSRDLGLWDETQEPAFGKLAEVIRQNGAIPGIQLAHAGRKGSSQIPWIKGPVNAALVWQTVAPSALRFSQNYEIPRQLETIEITNVVRNFELAAQRAIRAGFQVVEIHMAHGYLLHQFLSPFSNHRADEFGGSLENRMRLPLLVAERIRAVVPEHLPVFVRLSVTEWKEGGFDLPEAIILVQRLKEIGVDFIDCSSGGNVPDAPIPVSEGYQVSLASTLRKEVHVPTGAVGLITRPEHAEQILASGQADAILLGRELLRNPYWPLSAAHMLSESVTWPAQYERAKW